MSGKGLYANIAAKRRRIKAQKAAGKKPEKMRKPGTKGAPTAKAFRAAAKTAKKGTRRK
jgi:cysteine sulfinate desulfinase/cysteine desulfurase-like protein